MKRKITNSLIEWKNDKNRMPLIINGARQVGKTYIVEKFAAEHFEHFVYLNLEKEEALRKFFDREIRPQQVLQFIESMRSVEIKAGKTLIFFDEIQACDRALTSLKYFCEDTPEYHIIAAGSLLGVAINREKFSFPVGKVDELSMYPLDFEEFLWALDYTKLLEEIKNCYSNNKAMNFGLHELALEIYKKYF